MQKFFEIGSLIRDKTWPYAEKRAWTGFWNVLFVY